MSIDPETLRQIEELAADHRPLLVLDVDDVLLDFVGPLPLYLKSRGYRLTLDTFKLHGNVFEIESGAETEKGRVTELLNDFFAVQTDWQTIVAGAADSVAKIARDAEVVLLTAMPHRHRDTRRRHLDELGLAYPLLTTEMAKGPAIRRLRGESDRAVAFVDDLLHNLDSARAEVADAHLFHLMTNDALRALLPPTPEGIIAVRDWTEAEEKIASALGL